MDRRARGCVLGTMGAAASVPGALGMQACAAGVRGWESGRGALAESPGRVWGPGGGSAPG